MERLARQPQQHARILADGIEQNRIAEGGRGFPQDEDGLGLEPAQPLWQSGHVRFLVTIRACVEHFSASAGTGFPSETRPAMKRACVLYVVDEA
jgi:hypothetical protein